MKKIIDFKKLKNEADFEISKSGKTVKVWWTNELGEGQFTPETFRVKNYGTQDAYILVSDSLGRCVCFEL